MSDNQPDYRQAQEQEEQAWQEMQTEIERLIPFKADFEKFVASHETTAADGLCKSTGKGT